MHGPACVNELGNLEQRRLDLTDVRVLVVDDDMDALELLQTVLETYGARVRTASSAGEALHALEDETPDVLLSDIAMPIEDGYDLIRKVRALPEDHGRDVPAAALTAYARADDRRRVIEAGYTTHVAKPIDPAELVAIVCALAKAKRQGP